MGGDSARSIKAQVFDATGAKVGSEFLVNTTTAGFQDAPAIAGLDGGGFVIAWVDGSDLASVCPEIKAQCSTAPAPRSAVSSSSTPTRQAVNPGPPSRT